MCSIGVGEFIMLAVVGLIVFSASRMGALGNALGKFIYSFKRATRGEDLVDVTPKKLNSSKKAEVDHSEASGQ